MSIPFRDCTEIKDLGLAAYLRIDGQAPVFTGGLFLINAIGEPMSFSYNRVQVTRTFLWRRDDVRRVTVRRLAMSLLSVCNDMPRLLLCLGEEIEEALFARDIEVALPVCRIRTGDDHGSVDCVWLPGLPPEDSPEKRLFSRLESGGLLLEPFQRALAGLREVYKSVDGPVQP